MIRRFTYSLLAVFFLFTASGSLLAQDCTYTLELFDSFGDGWNGAELTVILNGTDTTVYSLDNEGDETDFFEAFEIPVTTGDSILLGYSGGTFEGEVTYFLYNQIGDLIFSDGPFPTQADTVFLAALTCSDCGGPLPGSVTIDRIRAFSVDLDWSPNPLSDPAVYVIEYGVEGFTPGSDSATVTTTTDTMIRLQPLLEDTTYEVYFRAICATDTALAVQGPFRFTTPVADDVGVTVITAPESGCELTAEQLTIGITNFGGIAQTLIPFNFSVNGVPINVPMPQDGLYTGVVGVDSTDLIQFDTPFDFSQPGVYELRAWTELEGDVDNSNDTVTVVITNAPLIASLPYREDFESNDGFWTTLSNNSNPTSWEHGMPNGDFIAKAGSGSQAWVTNLSGNYNNGEFSFLTSPCFDFSGEAEDPLLTFLFNLQTEGCCDELWVEQSVDGGRTWNKLGQSGSGLNWYNDAFNDWWDGNGGENNGWRLAAQELTGAAGQESVRLRFVFSSDGSVTREGAGIDNIFIGERQDVDLVLTSAGREAEGLCGTATELLNVALSNLGQEASGAFDLNYQIDGGAVVSETLDTTLLPDESFAYLFATPFDASAPGTYEVKVWVSNALDGEPINDTIVFNFSTALEPPYFVDFEDSEIPAEWETGPGVTVNAGHNAPSEVLYANLYTSNQQMRASMPNLGLIQAGDTLRFDYRYVNFSLGTVPTELGAGDSLQVRYYVDCADTSFVAFAITEANHVPTTELRTIALPLDEYAGQSVRVEFRGVWGTGDYFLDLDNINLRRCTGSLGLSISVTDASTNGSSDGAIAVAVGDEGKPFTFAWDFTQVDTSGFDNLPAGDYELTVTNLYGCSQTVNIPVGFLVSTDEAPERISAVSLVPNPTTDVALVRVFLREASEVRLTVFDPLGRPVVNYDGAYANTFEQRIDLTGYPAGLYFVRVRSGAEERTLRLLKH